MRIAFALVLIVCLSFLPTQETTAAPPAQTPRCNISSLLQPIRIFVPVDYVTATTVDVEGVRLQISICAPNDEAVTAQQMLNRLVEVLPKLSQLAGVRLRGSDIRQIVVLADDTLPEGVDGDFSPATGAIRYRSVSYDWTIVHEGAHYWANDRNFENKELWLIEGYAEYLTWLAFDQQSRWTSEQEARFSQICQSTPLLEWNQQAVYPYSLCGYVVGWQVFRDLRAAVGEERLRETLKALSDGPNVVTTVGLLQVLEQASGEDLVPIFKRRVFPASYDQALEQRSAFRAQLRDVAGRAAAVGVPIPPEIGASIDDWDFGRANSWLAPLQSVVRSATKISEQCRAIQLDCIERWREPLPDAVALGLLSNDLQQAASLVQGYAQLRRSAQELDLSLPITMTQSVARLELGMAPEITQATDILNQGRQQERACATTSLDCSGWRGIWRTMGLTEARNHIATTDRLLKVSARLEGDCAQLRERCRNLWQEAYRTRGPEAALRVVDEVGVTLQQGRDLEAMCASQSWPCGEAWRNAFLTNSPAATSKLIGEMRSLLPGFAERETSIQPANGIWEMLADLMPGSQPERLLSRSRMAFQDGDPQRAQMLLEQAVQEAKVRQQRSGAMPSLLVCGVALLVAATGVVSVVVLRRRSRTVMTGQPVTVPMSKSIQRAAPDEMLLTTLLERPPQE